MTERQRTDPKKTDSSTTELNDTEPQCAVITGGTRGIGYAVAEQLLEEGWNVALCGRSADSAKAARRSLGATERVLAEACDVGDQSAVEQFVANALERFGQIDALVNNAGIGLFAPVDEIDGDDWRRLIDTNLSAAFYATRAVAPTMKARESGWIFNIASLAGRNPFARGAAYNASKFGLVGFSDACMLDLRPHGIRVVAVLPGSVATDFSPPAEGKTDDWKLRAEDVARVVTDALRYPDRALPSRIELRPTKTASL